MTAPNLDTSPPVPCQLAVRSLYTTDFQRHLPVPCRGAPNASTVLDSALTDEEYRKLYALAVSVSLSKSLNRQEAEDVAQDIIIALWLRLKASRTAPVRDRTRWVAAAARYAANRMLRLRRREVLSPVMSDPLSAEYVEPDWRIDLGAVLRGLPPRDKEIFQLRFIERFPITKIAAETGVSESTVKRRIRCLKEILFGALTPCCPSKICLHALTYELGRNFKGSVWASIRVYQSSIPPAKPTVLSGLLHPLVESPQT